jgi:hypothetical protein
VTVLAREVVKVARDGRADSVEKAVIEDKELAGKAGGASSRLHAEATRKGSLERIRFGFIERQQSIFAKAWRLVEGAVSSSEAPSYLLH